MSKTLDGKLTEFLTEKLEGKGAYESSQEWLDDIANDYDIHSFVIADKWLDVDMMSEDWTELLEAMFNRWFAIDIRDEKMYVDWVDKTPYITNYNDLFEYLFTFN